jgi:putative sterol carrier protein
MSEQAEDHPIVEPDHYARLVRDATDEDLLTGLRENGELILEQIFQTMPARFRAERAASVDMVAEWRIRLPDRPEEMRWQVAIGRAMCRVERDGSLATDVVYSISALDFVKLVTGNAKGPALFMLGRLTIRGDLLKAARFQGYFKAPRPEGGGT